MAIQKPLILKNGKISQLPNTDELDLGYNEKLRYHLAALSAFDRVSSVTHVDSGLRTQRISTMVLSSSLYPDSDITKTVFYLDVGSINQRIDKIEITGAIFSPDSIRKVFDYSLVGIRYKLDSYYYEVF